MNIDGVAWRTISLDADQKTVRVIDQTLLPHRFETLALRTLSDVATAIRAMHVRGAPLIGVTAAWGLFLACLEDASDAAIEQAANTLNATRPTAVNLKWALDEMLQVLLPLPASERREAARTAAQRLADEDVETCRRIGEHGVALIRAVRENRGNERVNVLTHCNAGWLATVDWGTALAPIYKAHDEGIDVHVWVDETRPRSQGMLTAWELARHGVAHTLVADNAGGHLMQKGLVDLCLVGSDRTTRSGDVCNKIGTYLKALSAHDNGVPFYVALPHSTIDWTLDNGVRQIPIEERAHSEVHEVQGLGANGELATVRVTPVGCEAANPAFDVTPARLVSGLVTERGICEATASGLSTMYPDDAS